MGKTLLDLPPEIQTAIVSWVLRPNDTASLCLVSKQLYDVSMPGLYHLMYLNVDRWKKEELERFLTRGHRGHHYVRTLDIDSDELDTEPKASKLAKDVLEILPRNCLTSFRCPLETGIDNDLMILLSSTQRNLEFLSLGPLLQNALNIPKALSPWPHKIKTIVVPWKFHISVDLDFYQTLIERSERTLTALTVRSDSFMSGTNRKYIQHADNWELVARSLFAHVLTNPTQPMLALSDLNLQNQDLEGAARTWLRAIDFTRLRTLQLWNCSDADVLLLELISLNRNTPLRLHGLVLSFEDPDEAPHKGLEFISSISDLKYLNLCYCSEQGPADSMKAGDGLFHSLLSPHSASIKDLYFGLGANNSPNDNLAIRQLAIAMPPLYFEDAFANDWESYGDHLDILATLPKLKTLRILTWPVISDMEYLALDRSPTSRRRKKKIYLQRLDIIATSIARRFASVRQQLQRTSLEDEYHGLSVIIFGSAEQADVIPRAIGVQEVCYFGPISYKIRRKETDFGMILKAKRIDSHLMEYEEPVAYVVDEDTDQGLSLEAYTWGS